MQLLSFGIRLKVCKRNTACLSFLGAFLFREVEVKNRLSD